MLSTDQEDSPVTQDDVLQACTALRDHFHDTALTKQDLHDIILGLKDGLSESFTKQIKQEITKQANNLRQELQEELDDIRVQYLDQISQLKSLLSKLPAPVVRVNPTFSPIVNVPEQKQSIVEIVNKVEPTPITIENNQEPSIVNVQIPEQKKRKTTKQIGYNDHGFPVSVVETEE